MAGQLARTTSEPTSPTEVLRRQFAPQADDTELAYFAQVCRHLDVDPWAGHIALVPYGDGDGGKVHRPQLTVAGRRFIAQRTGRLRGIVGPEWCGPRRDKLAALEWREVWDEDDETPYAARVLVHVLDWDHPANGTVKWSEFAQTDRRGNLTRSWRTMPSHMLGKVAESLALRRGFPEVQQAVAYLGDDDDATLIREASTVAGAAGEIETPPPASDSRKQSNTPAPERAAPGRGGRGAARSGSDRVPDWVRDQDPENLR